MVGELVLQTPRAQKNGKTFSKSRKDGMKMKSSGLAPTWS